MLSQLWVGDAYEIFRLLKERKLIEGAEFEALAHDLKLLRIPLEKHEIVDDKKLKEPLLMSRYPHKNDETEYSYDKNDPRRAHIMPTGLSERGSAMWLVFDHRAGNQFWLERRGISERIVDLWIARRSGG